MRDGDAGEELDQRISCELRRNPGEHVAYISVLCLRLYSPRHRRDSRNAIRRLDATAIGTGLALGITYTVYRHAGLHAPGADLLLATLPSALLIGIVCLYMPCDAADVPVATLACTPLAVWRSRSFLCLALGDAVLIVIDVFAIAYAPKHVSGSECALIGLLENILAPLWVFARFGDVPSGWTVAGGALLLATLVGHEVAAREPVRVSQPGARGYRTVNNL